MQQDQKDPSGASESQASGEAQDASELHNAGGVESVAYDTHKKLLGEKKKVAERLSNAEVELQQLRENQMQADGKKDELIESLRKRLGETEGKYKKAVGNYAYKSVSSVVEREALKAGCVDPQALISLAGLEQLDVDENYDISPDQVQSLIDAEKKARPWLFNKAAPKLGSHNINPGFVEAKKEVKDMEKDDLWKAYAQATGAKGIK